jgi:DNA-binding NarL/FixJ family response regulator
MDYREPLTKREREVLALAAQGLTNPQIAEVLCISEATVRRHLNTIYWKRGVSAGVSARILAALEERLLVYVGPKWNP